MHKTLLFLLALSHVCWAAGQTAGSSVKLSAQVGNAVVFNNDGRGTSFGVGAAKALNGKWELRGDFEFARADIMTNPAFDAVYAELGGRAFTRSYALSATVSRLITVPKLERHQLSLGLGLLGRVYDMRTVTDMYFPEPDDYFLGRTTFTSGTEGPVRRDVVNLNALFSYRFRIAQRWGLSAFGRYENPILETGEAYGRVSWGDSRLFNDGLTTLFLEHQDGLRGWTYGLRADWSLRG